MTFAQIMPETIWIVLGSIAAGMAVVIAAIPLVQGTIHRARAEERRLTALETLERFRREECARCPGNNLRQLGETE